ncbi:BEN domain-containing protein 5-like isoform X2 [Dermacentor variabilis]|uniref:BEN domain-containing protein 5-like isoform X2 n=1 Tax=Dermacentor variabilis TaxID=34621 RepID=UPI003F5B3D85
MFACVQYTEDKERAALPVALIRDFEPQSTTDFKKDDVVMAYWADEDGRGENFYPANVTALADTLEDLLCKLKNSRHSFPRVILGKLHKGNLADEGLSKREERKRKREAARKELGNILKAFKQSENSELFQDFEDESKESVENHTKSKKDKRASHEIEWKKMEARIEDLEKELQNIEAEKEELARLLEEERERSRRLTDALLNKIEIAPTAKTATISKEVVHEILVPDVSPGGPPQSYEVLAEGSVEGASFSHALEDELLDLGRTDQADIDDSSLAASSSAPQEPKLFEVVDGNVHLGPGLTMPENKLSFIMKAGHEMKVAREMARFFWTVSELKIRSLTGHSSWKNSDTGKQQATPDKVTAIMNVVEKLIAETPSDIPGGKRRAQARKAIRDLFAESARIGQRSKTVA